MDRGLIYLPAQVAIVEAGQQGLLGCIDNDNGIRSLAATALGVFLALLYVGFVQTGELLLAVHPDHGVVGSFEQQVAPLLLQISDAKVNGLHTLLLIAGQQRSLAHKLLVGLLQQFLFLALKCFVIAIVNLTNTLEKRHVERDFVFQLCQHRHHRLFYLGNLWRFLCLGQGKEHTTHMVDHATTLFVSKNGVFKCGRIGIVDYRRNFLTLLLNGTLEGRQIVAGLNLTEIGCSIRQFTFL